MRVEESERVGAERECAHAHRAALVAAWGKKSPVGILLSKLSITFLLLGCGWESGGGGRGARVESTARVNSAASDENEKSIRVAVYSKSSYVRSTYGCDEYEYVLMALIKTFCAYVRHGAEVDSSTAHQRYLQCLLCFSVGRF